MWVVLQQLSIAMMPAYSSPRWFAHPGRDPQCPPQQPCPLAPPPHTDPRQHPPLPVPAARITVVRTAQQLQEAAAGAAQDVEVQAHLDLRPLSKALNPDHPGLEWATAQQSFSLLYASPPLRSIRGNCADADAAAALSLSAADASDLLPLKPRQCLLLFDDTWLIVSSSSLWLDNLYLKLGSRARLPHGSFVRVGLPTESGSVAVSAVAAAPDVAEAGVRIYVSAVTFHSSPRRSFSAINTRIGHSSVLVKDCVFTGWQDAHPMMRVLHLGTVSIRDTLFRNIDLRAEVVDVSFGGTATFDDVLFANVTLHTGRVVSTSDNDYQPMEFITRFQASSDAAHSEAFQACASVRYYAEDDAEYEIHAEPIHADDRHYGSADFIVRSAVMSDCLFMPPVEDLVMPGCATATMPARKRLLPEACSSAVHDLWRRANVSSIHEFDPIFQGAGYASYEDVCRPKLPEMQSGLGGKPNSPSATAVVASGLPAPAPAPQAENSSSDFPISGRPINVPCRKAVLTPNDAWFVAMAKALPQHPDLQWLPFELPPPPRTNRTSMSQLPDRQATAASAALTPNMRFVPASLDRPELPSPPPSRPSDAAPWPPMLPPAAISVSLGVICTAAALIVCMWLRRRRCTRANDARRRASRHRGECDAVEVAVPVVAVRETRVEHARPTSVMNPAYSYILPRHLSLLANARLRKDDGSLTGTATGSTLLSPSHSTSPRSLAAASKDAPAPLTHRGSARGTPPPSTVPGAPLNWHSDASRTDSLYVDTRRHTSLRVALQSLPSCQSAPLSLCQGPSLVRRAALDSRTSEISGATIAGDAASTMGYCVAPPQGVTCTFNPAYSDVKGERGDDDDSVSLKGGCGVAHAAAHRTPATALGRDWKDLHPADPCRGFVPSRQRAHSGAHGSVAFRCVQRQLDRFGEGDAFLGRFTMLGREHRRRAGQAVVQFAEDREGVPYALKFFLDREAFLTEARLYSSCGTPLPGAAVPEEGLSTPAAASLDSKHTSVAGLGLPAGAARFLPRVEAVSDSERDPRGVLLPPCIVMEKGESLQEWCNRADPDLFASVAVLSHVSARLADMHEAGYVHRDLKPANVMWLPRENRWTVIDFGCAARTGHRAALAFTLTYAAPEVVRAFVAQERQAEAAPAVDAWALGVMAFELLTGAPAFQPLTYGCDTVVETLRGGAALPWEGTLSAQHAQQLGVLKGPVLQLLRRDAAARPPLRSFHAACSSLFTSSSTVTA